MSRKAGSVRAGLLRRRFIIAAAAWPTLAWLGAAFSQSKQAPIVIGWINAGSREANGHFLAAFKAGLAALGWKEGSQLVFEERWADGQSARLQPLAKELAALKPARRSVARRAVEARFVDAARPEEIESAVSRLADEGVQALVVIGVQVFLSERRRIVKLALAHHWPVVAAQSEFTDEGGLLSYGIDTSTNYRRAAYYVDRILKGAKPGDLPVEQPTKFELVVNLKTAKALGITIPQSILVRADRVIE